MSDTEHNDLKGEFISYLEKHDVISHLSKVLLKLFEESDKPDDAIKFISENLYNPTDVSSEDLKRENLFLRQENQKLEAQFEELNAKLKELVNEQDALKLYKI